MLKKHSPSLIVLVVRTRRPFFKSRPGKYLLFTTLTILLLTLFIPFSPLQQIFGFSPLPLIFYFTLFLIAAGYIIMAEIAKHFFYHHSRIQ
ncbi:MAG: cation transporting ATPase C-terminal domain-containing protein [Bacteroidota bacterium]